MEFKNTLIKSITAVICVLAICFTAVSGVGKYTGALKDLSKNDNQEVASDETADDSSSDDNGSDAVADENNEAAGEDANAEEGSTDDAASADNGGSGSSSTGGSNSGSKTNGGSTDKGGSKAPSSTADIVAYYNTATAKANSSKVGFTKTRYADNASMPKLGALSVFESKIQGFIGLGADNKYQENIAKGNWATDNATGKPFNFLGASTLSAGDVTSAKCDVSGTNYTITLNLKNGSSAASKDNPVTQPNSALDKSGICTGARDHNNYDHKTATIVYAAIKDVPAVKNVSIKESYSNATVKAVINSATGQITSLTIEWKMSLNLSVVDGDATGNVHVKYTNFKY